MMNSVCKMLICGFSLLVLPAFPGTADGAAPLRSFAAGVSEVQTAAAADTLPAPGTLFSADTLTAILPATVFFQGRSAPLQLRNAAGTSFGKDAIVWASLVDSSGYSTAVQERYQFYLVSEVPLQFGSLHLPAGAYGGGFLGDHYLIMDLGGHTLGEGPVATDTKFARPRPLQMVSDHSTSVRLYLGRRWVLLQADPNRNNR
jgi:hypothetical protein